MKKLFLRSVFSISLLVTFLEAQHKIIYLISPPRSMSVAFLRMMQARGDVTIFHEPTLYLWDKIYYPELTEQWFDCAIAHNWDSLKEIFITEAHNKSVFIKEMNFSAQEFLLKDQEFVENPMLNFVFLVRNPHDTIVSYYKKAQSFFSQKISDQIICYKELYELYCIIKKQAHYKPLIILSEDLCSNPAETVAKFCDHVGIEFKEDALHWENLGTNFSGHQEWHESKITDLTQTWHGEAITSTHFIQPNRYEVDEFGQPTFSEIANLEHREICRKAYYQNLEYYNLLLQEISSTQAN